MSNIRNTPMQELRTTMTSCYGKDALEGKAYSDSDKSLRSVRWPSLSFLGETTPDTFAEALTPDMMEDGFLSRFLTIEYDGSRPYPNTSQGSYHLTPCALSHWRSLITRCVPYQGILNIPSQRIPVAYANNEAYDLLCQFDRECTDLLNGTQDEAERQAYNRAHLKALKVASLLAVADNPIIPKIEAHHAMWALVLIRRDIASFTMRRENGEIGNDDSVRTRKVVALLRKFFSAPPAASYRVPKNMYETGVIPRAYLQMQTSKHRAFVNHRLGQAEALNLTLRSLEADGVITLLSKEQAFDEFRHHGRCYRILQLPIF